MSNLILSLRLPWMLLAVGLGNAALAQTTEASVGNTQQEIKALQGQILQAILKGDTSGF